MKITICAIIFLLAFFFCSCESGKLKTFTLIYEGPPRQVLKCSCNEIAGKLNGVSICKDPNDKIFLKEDFKDGKRHGKHFEYFPNGEVRLEDSYFNDHAQGKSLEYYESGKIRLFRYYDDNELIYEKEYSEDGRILATILPCVAQKADTNEKIVFNDSFSLQVRLLYSKFDTVFLFALLDNDADGIFEDTIVARDDNFSYRIKPHRRGKNIFRANITEIDGNKMVETGEGNIRFEYFAE